METEAFAEAAKTARDLAEGQTAQAKFCNRAWLALLASATLVLFPESVTVGNVEKVKLPFALGIVDFSTYKIVGFFILAILAISYCQAYAAAHIMTLFAYKTIDDIQPPMKGAIARSLFRAYVTPTLARVAPLPELLNAPRIAAFYYGLLKLGANAVLLGIPSAALYLAFCELLREAIVPRWILLPSSFALCLTAAATLQVLCFEVVYSANVVRRLWKGERGYSAPKNSPLPLGERPRAL